MRLEYVTIRRAIFTEREVDGEVVTPARLFLVNSGRSTSRNVMAIMLEILNQPIPARDEPLPVCGEFEAREMTLSP
jgi:hypothetical protein